MRCQRELGIFSLFVGLLVSGHVSAATVCTNTDFPGAGDAQVRSYREVSQAHIERELAAGDRAEQQGDLRSAFYHYERALGGLDHPDLGVWLPMRCALSDDYQQAMRKLQSVGERQVEAALAEDNVLQHEITRRQLRQGMTDENMDWLKLMQGWGAMEYALHANQYERARQVQAPFLEGLLGRADAAARIEELQRLLASRAGDLAARNEQYELDYGWGKLGNDTVGLLPEEAAGAAALKALREQVVAATEANIAYWLDQEAQAFNALQQANGMVAETMSANAAVETLKMAQRLVPLIKTGSAYREEPWYSRAAQYERDILALGEQHGDALMELDKPFAAREYYAFAGADDKREAAQVLMEQQGEELQRSVRQSMEEGNTMFEAASEEEKKRFEDDADALADELGL